MKEIYVAPIGYKHGLSAIIITGLTSHFSLNLSKISEMQPGKQLPLPVSPKITARQFFHMDAAENAPSMYSTTIPPATHRFSLEAFLHRYGFS